jgi:DNA-binding CsgD family transcriptional regulator
MIMVWTARFPVTTALSGADKSVPKEPANAEPKTWTPGGAATFVAMTASGPSHSQLAITGRQLECLAWVAEGKSAIEIGMILGISGRTVEKHIAKICATFGVSRRIQAVDHARRLGLIAPDE